ncbi:MAG: hypothetical protein M3R04_09630, partial [bacterium]|nr:hypothetical protein [bacterium]
GSGQVANELAKQTKTIGICPTDGVNTTDLLRLVLGFVEKNPDSVVLGPGALAYLVISKTYPCP